MNLIDWKFELQHCAYDAAVGIKIAKLAGDGKFSTYLTAIDPGKSVNAHYHKNGDEHYHIIKGHGEITLIDVASKLKTTNQVSAFHSFVVPENTSHQLKNTGNEPLILMFSCPESHLQEDRFML
jgi:oxalate decarboxylase/phosphoglucose isomerase-like protein (cupin superfamily)